MLASQVLSSRGSTSQTTLFFVILAWSCKVMLAVSHSSESSEESPRALAESQNSRATLRQVRQIPSLLQVSSQSQSETAIQPQPRPDGHFLTNTELSDIYSIPCLEAQQKDPGVICSTEGSKVALPTETFTGPVSLGNYPNWQDAKCNSNGEFFCDPMGILSESERYEIAVLLKRLRYESHVTCGGVQADPVDEYNFKPFRTSEYHYQPFYLGVAMAEGWSPSDVDNDSLRVFGQTVASQWNMDNLFIGSPRPYAMCPNVAMLVVVPDRRQVYLSSQSCEFICQDRGGLKVTEVSLSELDRNGPAAAVKKGIEKVYSLLGVNVPLHGPLNVVGDQPVDLSTSVGGATQVSYKNKGNIDNNPTVILLRIVMVVAIVAVVGSALVALLVFLIAPGYIKHLGKRP